VLKKIGLSLVYFSLFAGLYGCSCSEKPKEQTDAGLYIADITVNEGDGSGTTDFSIEVNLQRENQDTVTVNYEVVAVQNPNVKSVASAGIDFIENEDTLTFDPESNDTQSISFSVKNDDLYEHDESFLINLIASSGAKIIAGEAQVTIKDNDPAPVASLSIDDSVSTTFSENDVDRIQIQILLDAVSGVDAEVAIDKSVESENDQTTVGKTAANRVDYLLKDADGNLMGSNENIVIPAGETTATVNLDIVDDGITENDENFSLRLRDVLDVSVSSTTLDFSIMDNDLIDGLSLLSVPLNDTGLTEVNNVVILPEHLESETEFAVNQLTEELRDQMDQAFGRDAAATSDPVTLTKTGGGRNGFDFTKLKTDGSETTENAPTEEGSVIPWDCVRDNNTGLVWEVKTRGNLGLRALSRNFYWYDPNSDTNGGVAGVQGEFQCDETDLSTCNTAYYIADVNANKLCGLSGWRLPTLSELRSIVDYNVRTTNVSVAYDTDYFAGDTIGVSRVWTSTSYPPDPTKAWTIRFGQGVEEEIRDKSVFVDSAVRLVNDSLIKQAQE